MSSLCITLGGIGKSNNMYVGNASKTAFIRVNLPPMDTTKSHFPLDFDFAPKAYSSRWWEDDQNVIKDEYCIFNLVIAYN